MNRPLPGVGYTINSTREGFSFDISQNIEGESNVTQSTRINPFDCIIERYTVPDTDPVQYEYRLKVVLGVCQAFVTNDGAEGDPDGSTTKLQAIIYPNIYPTGSRVSGTDANSVFMDEGGYMKLTPETNYMLFVYLLQPNVLEYTQDFKAIQLVLSESGLDQPDSIIDTLPAYCFFEFGTEGGGLNYGQTWAIRENIAQFVWNDTDKRFEIFQYTNAPKLFYPVYNAVGSGSGDAPTSDMIGDFTGYTKDLATFGSYISPAQQDQFPPLHT